MYDPPTGMPAKVERLLQVLAVLQAAELPVARSTLMSRVDDYREDAATVAAAPTEQARAQAEEALHKKVNLDLANLRELGFSITDVAGEGAMSTYTLRPTPWRLPVELGDADETLLAWLLAGATPSTAQGTAELPSLPDAGLLGSLPSALDLAHAALAGRRQLLIEHHGQARVLEPVQMSVHGGRRYLLARYPGAPEPRGFRLDRLVVTGLGEVMAAPPAPVDALLVLDPTAWRVHASAEVELRCSLEDAAVVGSWFPRAVVTEDGGEVVLAFGSTNLEAVVDRVIGLAGAARLVSPVAAVEALRARLLDALSVPA